MRLSEYFILKGRIRSLAKSGDGLEGLGWECEQLLNPTEVYELSREMSRKMRQKKLQKTVKEFSTAA